MQESEEGAITGSVFSKIMSGLVTEKENQPNSNINGKEKPFVFSPEGSSPLSEDLCYCKCYFVQ